MEPDPSAVEGERAGLTEEQAHSLRNLHGYNEVKTNQKPEWKKIAGRYLDWVSIVILVAAVVSAAVPVQGERSWTSFALLLFELNLIVWVGYYSDRNAGNAVKELEELSAPTAQVKRDGKWKAIPTRELVVGDVIMLKGGDVIPADARVLGPGEPLKIDESSLTGESLAVTRKPGDRVLSGAVVSSGELPAEVTAIGANTFFGKTITLLGAPDERGHLYQVLNRVSVALAFVALVGVAVIFIVLLARGEPLAYAVTTCFVIFVSVVPIGMPVVTTTVLAIGAREMADEKAIVSRLSALEELSGMEVLASDKTGTLTQNKLGLDQADMQGWGGASAAQVLLQASLSANWEHPDAIDTAITNAVGERKALKGYEVKKVTPFNPVDKRTTAVVDTPEGKEIVVTKGAPQVIRDLLPESETAARSAVDEYIASRAQRGLRALGVAVSQDGGGSWRLVGLLSLLDPPRVDSAATIQRAQELGVEVKMVTGDQHAIAVETSRRLGLGTNIMDGHDLLASGSGDAALVERVNEVDGFAGVYPEHKHRIVEALQAKGRIVGMTGDGVNDAPALKKANVGIAVAGATSAAKGAADIILTQEGISTIITAIIRSRAIFRRLETYIIYRMASSLLILGFFFFAILIFEFEIPTWVLVLISLTNDLSVMATSLDKVHSSDIPQLWNMTKCLAVAAALAAAGVLATMLLLFFALPNEANWWHIFDTGLLNPVNLNGTTPGQVVAVMFLALTAIIQLQIILTRNPSFFWLFKSSTAPRPSLYLVLPVAFFLSASTFIAVYWPESVRPDGGRGYFDGAGWAAVGVTWAYVIIWWLVADLAKVSVQMVFRRYDKVVEAARHAGRAPPAWTRAIDAPGTWAEAFADRVGHAFDVATDRMAALFKRRVRRPPSREDLQADMARQLARERRRRGSNCMPIPMYPATPRARGRADSQAEEVVVNMPEALPALAHSGTRGAAAAGEIAPAALHRNGEV